jgi:hypothetical protein
VDHSKAEASRVDLKAVLSVVLKVRVDKARAQVVDHKVEARVVPIQVLVVWVDHLLVKVWKVAIRDVEAVLAVAIKAAVEAKVEVIQEVPVVEAEVCNQPQ